MYAKTRAIALGGIMAALSIVILLIGSMLGIGMYAGPMLAGLCLLPVKRELGCKWHILLWITVSLLSLMMISDMEQNLMYLCLFGCYPIWRPMFQTLKSPIRLAAKLLYFNLVTIAAEVIVLLFFMPEVLGTAMIIVLLVFGNITFLCYDLCIPLFEAMMEKRLKKMLQKRR